MGMPRSSDSYYKPWVGSERKGGWGQQKEKGKDQEGDEKEKGDMGAGEGSLPSTAASGMRSLHPRQKGDCCLDLLAPLAENRKETLSPFDTILSRRGLRKKEMSSLLGLFTT